MSDEEKVTVTMAVPMATKVTVEVELDVLMSARLDRFIRLYELAHGAEGQPPISRGKMLASLAKRELYRKLAAIQREDRNVIGAGTEGRFYPPTRAESKAEKEAAEALGLQPDLFWGEQEDGTEDEVDLDG